MDSLHDFSLHVILLLRHLFDGSSGILELWRQASNRCITPHDSSTKVGERGHMMNLKILHSIVCSQGNIVPLANTILKLLK